MGTRTYNPSSGGGGSAGITSVETGSLVGLTSKDIDFSAVGDAKYLLRLSGMTVSAGSVNPSIGFLDGGAFGLGQFLYRAYLNGIHQNNVTIVASLAQPSVLAANCIMPASHYIARSDLVTPVAKTNVDIGFEVYGGGKFLNIFSYLMYGDFYHSGFTVNMRSTQEALISGQDDPSYPYTSIDGIRLASMSSVDAGTYELFEVTE